MNYFHIDVELQGAPVRALVADNMNGVPGEQDEISFRVFYPSAGSDRELLLVLGETGWINASDRIEEPGLPLVWKCFPELIEPHLLPDEKLHAAPQEDIDRIGAKISAYMMPRLRRDLGLFNKNLANSFFE